MADRIIAWRKELIEVSGCHTFDVQMTETLKQTTPNNREHPRRNKELGESCQCVASKFTLYVSAMCELSDRTHAGLDDHAIVDLCQFREPASFSDQKPDHGASTAMGEIANNREQMLGHDCAERLIQ